jgi:UDP-glucose 4-epimerase
VFVADVVAHFLAAMASLREGAGVFNACSGRATSIFDLAETIACIVRCPIAIRHSAGRIGDIRASLGDPSAARRTLGLDATTSITEGLERTLKPIETIVSR